MEDGRIDENMLALSIGLTTVSYTHLDVYKRQVFYRDVMYREGAEGKDEAYLKLYDGHDWKWSCVRLDHTDMEYLRKCWSDVYKRQLL